MKLDYASCHIRQLTLQNGATPGSASVSKHRIQFGHVLHKLS